MLYNQVPKSNWLTEHRRLFLSLCKSPAGLSAPLCKAPQGPQFLCSYCSAVPRLFFLSVHYKVAHRHFTCQPQKCTRLELGVINFVDMHCFPRTAPGWWYVFNNCWINKSVPVRASLHHLLLSDGAAHRKGCAVANGARPRSQASRALPHALSVLIVSLLPDSIGVSLQGDGSSF